jgi:outer membrane protein OmpA-like peptidoglycan-associated protein
MSHSSTFFAGDRGGARLASLAALFAALLVVQGDALAQDQTIGFNLDQYRAAETPEDGFAIWRPNDLGRFRFGVQIHLDYANRPLVWEHDHGEPDSEEPDSAPVEHMLVGNLGLSLGMFRRLVIFAGLPVNLVMMGDETLGPAGFGPDGFTVGDLYLGARVRIAGANDGIVGFGFQAAVTAPTAMSAHTGQRYAGEANATGHFELALEIRPGPARFTFNVGARVREGADYDTFVTGHELTYGFGMSVFAADWVALIGEVYGSGTFTEMTVRENLPFEGIAGARFMFGRGFTIGVAAGAGLTRGAGSPRARAVFTFGYALPEREEPTPEPTVGDRDHDGIPDDVDECPDDPEDIDQFEDENGCPDPDNDQDGILDGDDQCPNDPEDRDQFEDENGCPDPDNDQDGILDGADACPNEAEDRDQFEDEDGCPDPDNDQDGLLDPADECPNEPEDIDQFEDEDGCPDPDNDQDTVLDVDDDCPLAPGLPANRGCPVAVRVERSQIRILQRIEFEFDSDRLMPSASPILEEVVGVLRVNAQIERIRIEGHTDSQGRDSYNMELSDRRANSVMRWLTEHGVAAGRLEAQGFGETRPIESNRTRAGRQANRRVEFHIVSPAPPAE